MGFRQGAYATVWEIKAQGDNFTKIRVSISRKNKKTDEWVNDFNGFVSLIGEAHKKADRLADMIGDGERARIRLGSCDVSNRYDKDEEREYTNFTLFDFDFTDDLSSDSDEPSSEKSEKKPAKKQAAKNTAKKTSSKKKSSALLDDSDEAESEPELDEEDQDLPF